MHDRLFLGSGRRAWGQGGTADLQTFLGYAEALKLDVPKLQQCVETNAHAPTIEADFRDAAKLGIRSTPSFVVNGQLLIGAYPYETWQRILDDLLAEK